ncbi:hypothetical protein IQ272_07585 [Chroococcidiopsidales cyanobacterium LEGE 13417]|nr:hypothetical protein [Chroococcidiopsidales cyanobacterium LEGE 13417]
MHPFKLSLIDQMKLAREREIVFGKARPIRYYEISKTDSPTTNPLETWFVMTSLPKSWQYLNHISIGQLVQTGRVL